MTNIILQTERLIIRRWQISDIEAMANINQNPKVMEYFPAPKTYAETTKFIQYNIDLYNLRGYCFYAVELKDTHEFIGFIGLNLIDFDAPFTPAIEIGWRIDNKYWNNGYATEGAIAIRDYAFNNLGINELVSFTTPTNQRSIRIMEKLGFKRNPFEDFQHPWIASGHPFRKHVLYRLSRNA